MTCLTSDGQEIMMIAHIATDDLPACLCLPACLRQSLGGSHSQTEVATGHGSGEYKRQKGTIGLKTTGAQTCSYTVGQSQVHYA